MFSARDDAEFSLEVPADGPEILDELLFHFFANKFFIFQDLGLEKDKLWS